MPVNDVVLLDQADDQTTGFGIEDDRGGDCIGSGSTSDARPTRGEYTVEGSARSETVSVGAAASDMGVPDAAMGADEPRIGPLVRFTLVALLAIVAVEALHEIFGLAGSRYSNLIDSYFYDVVATGAGVVMLIRGLGDRTGVAGCSWRSARSVGSSVTSWRISGPGEGTAFRYPMRSGWRGIPSPWEDS